MKYRLLRYAEFSVIVFAILGFITLFYIKVNHSPVSQVNQITLPKENLIYVGDLTSNKIIYVVVDPLCPYCALEYFQLKKVYNYTIVYILYPLSNHKYSRELASAILCEENNSKRAILLEKAFKNQAFIDDIKEIFKKKV